ncbi:MAG: hypothetical protein JW860_08335 [Sedimentisphaerales bacterium]|nr:hypothetical protein [Sedimentisphaerales bacterium]
MSSDRFHIEKVRAEPFSAGMLKGGRAAPVAGLVLVSWQSRETDIFFQVYVDGRRAGTTSHPRQRYLLVDCEAGHTAAIEVVAVDVSEFHIDHAKFLNGFSPNNGAYAIISFPRLMEYPRGSSVRIFGAGGGGPIDYSEPLAQIEVWDSLSKKWGWGLDTFGGGDFGYSGTGAIGWGKGSFGEGGFGFDAEVLTFRAGAKEAGTYRFAVRMVDRYGHFNEEQDEILTVYVDPLPAAPEVAIEGYDEEEDRLVLRIG